MTIIVIVIIIIFYCLCVFLCFFFFFFGGGGGAVVSGEVASDHRKLQHIAEPELPKPSERRLGDRWHDG